jgi:endonuclease YncB( thermonuclease family)
MNTLRPLLIIVAAVVTSFHASDGMAAKAKKWEKLTACQYVEDKNNDGDSFRVKCASNAFVLRLYFVDAPETNLRDAERTRLQSVHFGASLEETMKAGVKASEVARNTLKSPFDVWTKWTSGGGRGKEVRYLGIVEADGKSLIEILVRGGLARIVGQVAPLPNGEKSTAYKKRLAVLEGEARKERLGAWAHSTK